MSNLLSPKLINRLDETVATKVNDNVFCGKMRRDCLSLPTVVKRDVKQKHWAHTKQGDWSLRAVPGLKVGQ